MPYNKKASKIPLLHFRQEVIELLDGAEEERHSLLEAKALSEKYFLERGQTESDAKVYQQKVHHLDKRVEGIELAICESMRSVLTDALVVGFDTPVPITKNSRIEVIHPDLWLSLKIDLENNRVYCGEIEYVGLFFQYRANVPKSTLDAISGPNEAATINEDYPFYLSPYMRLMMEAAKGFDISNNKVPLKKIVTSWLQENAQLFDLEGKISDRMLEAMATIIRPIEAQKGGNRRY